MIRRRGAGWNVLVRVDGHRHEYGPRSVPLLRHGSREEVEEWVWAEYRRLVREARTEASGDIRFSELVQRWRDEELSALNPGGAHAYEDSLKPIEEYFVERKEDPPIRNIRPADIKQFLAWRRTARRVRAPEVRQPRRRPHKPAAPKPLSPHTVAKDRRGLHRLFEYACEIELLDVNPVSRVKAPKADPRTPHILTPEEFDRLLNACDDEFLRLWVLVLGESGARSMSEVLHLRWEDVDLAGGFINIVSGRNDHRTKGGKSRWTPMTPRLAAALRDHFARYRLITYAGNRTPWLFHHTITNRRRQAGERIRSLYKRFNDALKQAEIPRVRPHDLRHRRITTWLAEGRDVTLVKEAVGHANLATTMKYTHLAREHLRRLADDPDVATSEKQKA